MAPAGRRAIPLHIIASSLAGGLGLLAPIVALVLVLAYGLGHVRGTPRLFLGFVALVAVASGVPKGMRLSETLRVGKLTVSGTSVLRQEEPRRFWTWVAIEALFVALNAATAIFLVWAAIRWSA